MHYSLKESKFYVKMKSEFFVEIEAGRVRFKDFRTDRSQIFERSPVNCKIINGPCQAQFKLLVFTPLSRELSFEPDLEISAFGSIKKIRYFQNNQSTY